MDFTDKSVLITGSTRGIGYATAREFLNLGARVAINGKTKDSVDAAIEKFSDYEDRLVTAPGDIGTVSGCESVVQKAVEGLGGLHILVNAAGVGVNATIEESDEVLWDQTMDINLKGSFFCSRAALAALRQSSGVIINVASDDGLMGEKGMAVYCASKGGVVNLTRAMALDLTPEVRVNCVCPGYVDTDMVRRDYIDKADNPVHAEEMIKALAPMNRIASPGEIAKSITYLSSDDARFITGAALQIDGGTTAGH
jgi:NAD(P)-dependent dehydrogenase (short-subunit alcohol dehydrogenase family)